MSDHRPFDTSVAGRVLGSIVSALVLAALGGLAGMKGPDHHPHDVVGPILFMACGAGAGLVVGLGVSLYVAFQVFPPERP